jgi:hypothetical protein
VVVAAVLDERLRLGESMELLDGEQLVADAQNDSTSGYSTPGAVRGRLEG